MWGIWGHVFYYEKNYIGFKFKTKKIFLQIF
jgi:hypothetical protein